jgi:hypothetical protein
MGMFPSNTTANEGTLASAFLQFFLIHSFLFLMLQSVSIICIIVFSYLGKERGLKGVSHEIIRVLY